MKPKRPPSVFAYENYRRYLADWIASKKRNGVSMRAFSQKAGFKAHNVVRLVIAGERNLSVRSIPKFVEALELNEDEASYFEQLVLMNQAPSLKQRLRYLQRLAEHPQRQKTVSLKKSQHRLFRSWLGPVIYELMQIPGITADPDALADLLSHDHPRREVEAAFGDLVAVGLIGADENGEFKARTERLDTGDGFQSHEVTEYHQHALLKAADAMLTIPSKQRFFQVLTVSVPRAKVAKLTELCRRFEEEVWRCVDTPEGDPETVVQLGVHIFPVLRPDHD